MSEMVKSVQEFLTEYNVPYKRDGHDYIIKCPFHNDKRPSLKMDIDEGMFQCWSCKAKGNMATFISKIANCDMQTAVNIVYGKATIKFKKKVVEKKKQFDNKYNELVNLIYCFLFRDTAVIRLLSDLEEFADNKIFDELVECQKNILKPNSTTYLKQHIFHEILDEVDDNLLDDGQKYKKLLEEVKNSIIRKEVKMSLNLYNNKVWKEIYHYIDVKRFADFVLNADLSYNEYLEFKKIT